MKGITARRQDIQRGGVGRIYNTGRLQAGNPYITQRLQWPQQLEWGDLDGGVLAYGLGGGYSPAGWRVTQSR